MSRVEFKGECIGVRLQERGGPSDPHAEVAMMVEDDGNWFTKQEFSSYWLDEAIEMLIAAREHLRTNCKPTVEGYDLLPREEPDHG